MKNKKLPLIFWLLVLAALLVSAVLIVGLLLENKDKIPFKFDLNFRFPGFSGRQDPQVSGGSRPEPTPVSMFATPSPAPAAENEIVCTHHSFEVPVPAGQRLVGWSQDPYALEFWTLEPAQKTVHKWNMLAHSLEQIAVEHAAEQDLACAQTQGSNCLFLQPQQNLDEIRIDGGWGWTRLRQEGAEPLVMTELRDNRLWFHQSLGLCAQRLPPRSRVLVTGEPGHTKLLAYHPGSPYFLEYSTESPRPYAASEVPAHPTHAWLAREDGLNLMNCQDQGEGSLSIEGVALSQRNLALQGHLKRWIGEDLIWLYRARGEDWTYMGSVGSRELGKKIAGLLWVNDDALQISTTNFFQTKFENFRFFPRLKKPIEIQDQEFLVGFNQASREQLNGSAGPTAARLTVDWQEAKRQQALVQLNEYAAIPLNGSGAGSDPRLIWSDRKQGTALLVYQLEKDASLQGMVINCSAKQ